MQRMNAGAQLPSKQKPVRSLLGSSLFDEILKRIPFHIDKYRTGTQGNVFNRYFNLSLG